ncbi:tetratricopeptide (TPR) repeat protein [Bacillus mesophilus]|uniref:Tetratricopeptide repeat protein n=1 Tax=Bacillus mesophilus TaxID=1808955 RepID=A0A6M0Q9K8_9BACI|nr:tetratricopeptide repeat protein [Bacillus mesophilus]MBM7661531.1 tetratricopeptide (TPR) repeat protein [Bacillus mesophilus]NEY72200.1 tetratricopeptide repeat protein [Bacillus mesophilus]
MSKQIEATREKAVVIPFHLDGDYFYKKGLRAYRNRDFERSIQLLKRAHELEPEEPIILCQLAAVLSEIGEYQTSTEYLRIVINELDPEMVECYYFIANNFAHLGLFQEAKRNALKYMELSPDGEFIEDTEDLLEVLSLDSDEEEDEDDIIFLQDHARDLMEKGQFQEAIEILHELIDGHPQFWSAYNNLALSQFYMGKTDEALKTIEDVLVKNPGNLHAMCNKVVIHFYLRNDEVVNNLIDHLKVVHPMLMEHRYKLGATFGMVGRFDLSLQWLLSLKKAGYDGDATYYYWLTHAAYHMKHEQVAQYSWKKVLILSPDKRGSAPWEQAKPLEEKSHSELLSYYLHSKEQNKVISVKTSQYEKGLLVADLLYTRYQDDRSNLPTILAHWFHLLPMLSEKKLNNASALAAAVEFLFLEQIGKATTQAAVSRIYNISAATARKYISLLNAYRK